jgi:transcriptional regulator with XRE-family HTH domain
MKDQFDAEGLFAALDSQRLAKDLNWKQVAEESGVGASTLTRMSQGKRPDVDSLAALAKWSNLRIDDFVLGKKKLEGQAEPLANISVLLRADPNLSAESAAALEEVMRVTYLRFRKKKK